MNSEILHDISLSDLSNFYKEIHLYKPQCLDGFSKTAIKLKVQILITKLGFHNFNSFIHDITNSDDLKEKVIRELKSKNDELFRDADCWICFLNELKKNKKEKFSVCFFESGNYSELCSLLILLKCNGLIDRAIITVVDVLSRVSIPSEVKFSQKEIDQAKYGYERLGLKCNLIDFFELKNSDYIFSMSKLIKPLSIDFLISNKIEYDCVISRNNSIILNREAHQKLFNTYLKLTKSDGYLFTGNKEDFSWCDGYKYLNLLDVNKPVYVKKF